MYELEMFYKYLVQHMCSSELCPQLQYDIGDARVEMTFFHTNFGLGNSDSFTDVMLSVEYKHTEKIMLLYHLYKNDYTDYDSSEVYSYIDPVYSEEAEFQYSTLNCRIPYKEIQIISKIANELYKDQ